ncbi:NAD(P)/FAD-dependent oxidoreductase [Rhizobium calliandrae]|uniref:NAD(P)/FAD-dependent oxidoreductase n=1 Tax=Rhizobium calliandrae TaxID=1312182 RepID=A0ABT7KLN8_9HYPH|nr:NAD(P)/FAD-dependent oxidoreductase [Rhizobium calliandrae]MDL2409560.1 NAD(P)/FAD-dependent oxidoreductase [Rhizobium calliandrae]
MPKPSSISEKPHRSNTSEESCAQRPHQIVIVGGGIAGLEIASNLPKRTGRTSIAVTLIDREPAYVWKPMLHTIAAGTSDVSQQETSYVAQARNRRFVFEPGELKGIDRQGRKVYLSPTEIAGRRVLPERAIDYDTLILAIGSAANDFGTPGVREHCLMIDSRSQAMNFNREVMARILETVTARNTLNIAVVGGGATGVELAAELIQLADVSAYYGAAGLRDQINVTLIESGPNLLGAFPDRVAIAARGRLEELGVTVLTGARVVAAEADCFRLADGRQVSAELKVWAAGVKGADACAKFEGLELTRNNQIVVTPTLQTTVDSRIFAVGDCSSLPVGDAGKPLPPAAQVAHQQASHLIRHLPRWLRGKELPTFTFRDFGSIVSLGGYGAYGSLGQFGLFTGGFLRGRVAQLGHILLYRSYQSQLHGFWRGGLIWLADMINSRVRPRIRIPD